ncbi:MAG: hypothetical protein ACO3NL_09040, partial [Phycisphaerales bacterium]
MTSISAEAIRRVRSTLDRFRGDGSPANRSSVRRLLASLDASEAEIASNVDESARQRLEVRFVEACFGARSLVLGCEVEREVPGPEGRTCDFLLRRGGAMLAVHIKRLEAIGEVPPPPMTAWERGLETIPLGLVVSVRRPDRLPDETSRWLSGELRGFLEHARVGEERLFRDDRDRAVAHVRVVGVSDAGRVRIVPASTTDLEARVVRFRRLLRRAYRQFLPDVENLILFGTVRGAADAEARIALADALLGTPMERWDRFPMLGDRVAHGRGTDGFWESKRHAASRLAGWFAAASAAAPEAGRWWLRPREHPADTMLGF